MTLRRIPKPEGGGVLCGNYGDPDVPGCLREADDRFTMCFDDIGQPSIHWCSYCGPKLHAINGALLKALESPDMRATLEAAIEEAEQRQRERSY